MECPSCGRYSPPDRTTGYDADDVCPLCQFEAEVAQRVDAALSHDIVDRAAMAHQSALQDLATIGSEAARTTDRARLWELLDMARELETRARKLTDGLFGRIEGVLADTEEPDTRSPF